ncbi:MAG: guanylate kinase [Thermodesulfobacteriota bacterium]
MEKREGKGILFVISAPSGTGKTTLTKRLIEELPGLRFSVSYTTRSPRTNELEGKDYYFITRELFKKMVDCDEFLEWAEVLGNYYGTHRRVVDDLLRDGVDLILDIDTQGAKKVREKVKEAVLIYLLPPSLSCLEERLLKRGLDSAEQIQYRLAQAKKDMEEAFGFHYVVLNDQMEEALARLKAIVLAERCRREKDEILYRILNQWEVNDGKNYSRGLS